MANQTTQDGGKRRLVVQVEVVVVRGCSEGGEAALAGNVSPRRYHGEREAPATGAACRPEMLRHAAVFMPPATVKR